MNALSPQDYGLISRAIHSGVRNADQLMDHLLERVASIGSLLNESDRMKHAREVIFNDIETSLNTGNHIKSSDSLKDPQG